MLAFRNFYPSQKDAKKDGRGKKNPLTQKAKGNGINSIIKDKT